MRTRKSTHSCRMPHARTHKYTLAMGRSEAFNFKDTFYSSRCRRDMCQGWAQPCEKVIETEPKTWHNLQLATRSGSWCNMPTTRWQFGKLRREREREKDRRIGIFIGLTRRDTHPSQDTYVGYVGHAGRRKSYYGSNMPQLATLLTLLQQMSNKFPTTTTSEVAATATVAATTAAAATDDSGNNGREIRQQAFSKIFTVWKL